MVEEEVVEEVVVEEPETIRLEADDPDRSDKKAEIYAKYNILKVMVSPGSNTVYTVEEKKPEKKGSKGKKK